MLFIIRANIYSISLFSHCMIFSYNLNYFYFEIYEKYKQGNVIIKKTLIQVFRIASSKQNMLHTIVYRNTI